MIRIKMMLYHWVAVRGERRVTAQRKHLELLTDRQTGFK